ncbi:MAG: AAA family ATPase [Aestuariivirga sp.]|uniref:AAA family ATPase n=1 Tax=Aestuariivirga sp. TaxID=2650926 RepID=UPI0025C17643|nr:AAA family ATPase [Aestuariivirga sp.]MCA3560631.1 AAA family ATPase [Aestuariivirga sp.]
MPEITPIKLEIPSVDQNPDEVLLNPGDVVFVMGENGAGKSSLLQRIFATHWHSARRISAHRQNWLYSNLSALSAADRNNAGQNINHHDTTPHSRWRDDYSTQRPQITLYDLVDAQNARGRGIAAAADAGDLNEVQRLSKERAPLSTINLLMQKSNLPIELSIGSSGEVLASKNGSYPYSVAELSDGERNAVLICADVLTAKHGTLLLVDEPERHLHRSIISPLLTALFNTRPDCTFVVSTHDVTLAIDNPDSRTLLLQSCQYAPNGIVAWDYKLFGPEHGISEETKKAILGARRRLLFVEGRERSLDLSLYRILFPNMTIVPKQNCREVIQSVVGLRSSKSLHWLEVFGLIDGDQRTPVEIEELRSKGVYTLPLYSIESVYYHPKIFEGVAERKCQITGDDKELVVENGKAAAIASLRNHRTRLCHKVVSRSITHRIFASLQTQDAIEKRDVITFRVDTGELLKREEERFDRLIEEKNLDGLLSIYPLRETQALGLMAGSLGLRLSEYEKAVRKLLLEDSQIIQFARGIVEPLLEELGEC